MAQPSRSLQMAIQFLHAAIADEKDPADVQTLSQCLAKMTQVQSGIMQPKGQSSGYSGSPTSGPQTAADPRQFIGA